MILATLPVLNDSAYSAIDLQALRTYFLQRTNPIHMLMEKPHGVLNAILSFRERERKVVAQLSDDALLTLVRYDIAMAIEELCGTGDTTRQRAALTGLIERIDTGRVNGLGQCMIYVVAEVAGYTHPQESATFLHRVRARAYELPRGTLLPTEVMLLTISAQDASPYAQRVRRLLRTAASDLLMECEVDTP